MFLSVKSPKKRSTKYLDKIPNTPSLSYFTAISRNFVGRALIYKWLVLSSETNEKSIVGLFNNHGIPGINIGEVEVDIKDIHNTRQEATWNELRGGSMILMHAPHYWYYYQATAMAPCFEVNWKSTVLWLSFNRHLASRVLSQCTITTCCHLIGVIPRLGVF